MSRRLRVWRLFPPRKAFGACSRSTTEAPASRAVIAAQRPAFPPPTTRTSQDCITCVAEGGAAPEYPYTLECQHFVDEIRAVGGAEDGSHQVAGFGDNFFPA